MDTVKKPLYYNMVYIEEIPVFIKNIRICSDDLVIELLTNTIMEVVYATTGKE
jgi:hypothetical protein